MAYQFYNDTATIKIVENGQAKNLSKSLITLTVQGNDLVIGYDSNENWLRIPYTAVTLPASASAELLRDTINSYLTQTVSANVSSVEVTNQYLDAFGHFKEYSSSSKRITW